MAVSDSQPIVVTLPSWPKPQFPERAYRDGYGARISAARQTLWALVGDELKEIDSGALQRAAACDSEAWAIYYEAHLARRQRQASEEDKPTEELPPSPAPTTTQLSVPTPEFAPVANPQTKEELEQLFLAQDLVVIKARDHELEKIAKDAGDSRAYFPAKEKVARARWQVEDQQTAAARRVLVAKLFPVLTTPPRHVDHVQERAGQGESAFETVTRPTKASALRPLTNNEKRKPKPDSS